MDRIYENQAVIEHEVITAEAVTTTETTAVTTNNVQPRYKSWAMWLAVLGALGVILNATGVFEKIGIDS